MLIRLLAHLRSNVIAYLALCISLLGLAGGAYAAITLPANSVGARQIRNGSIAPVKLDHRLIGASIRAWAQVSAQGHVLSSSGGARELVQPGGTHGKYLIAWGHRKFPKQCTLIATAGGWLSSSAPFASAYATAYAATNPQGTDVMVQTTNAEQQQANEPFSVAVIC